jgi:hypothetical protein
MYEIDIIPALHVVQERDFPFNLDLETMRRRVVYHRVLLAHGGAPMYA